MLLSNFRTMYRDLWTDPDHLVPDRSVLVPESEVLEFQIGTLLTELENYFGFFQLVTNIRMLFFSFFISFDNFLPMLASLTSKRHSSKRYFQNHFLLPNGMDSLPLKSHLEFIRIAYYSNVTQSRSGLGQCPGLRVSIFARF